MVAPDGCLVLTVASSSYRWTVCSVVPGCLVRHYDDSSPMAVAAVIRGVVPGLAQDGETLGGEQPADRVERVGPLRAVHRVALGLPGQVATGPAEILESHGEGRGVGLDGHRESPSGVGRRSVVSPPWAGLMYARAFTTATISR